jgi:hypothetical protein
MDRQFTGRAALEGLDLCASTLREEYPRLIVVPHSGSNDRFPLRVGSSLSFTGDRQAEHLALSIDFCLNDSSGIDAASDVNQGECKFTMWGPQSSIHVSDAHVYPWALAHVAASVNFFLEAVPAINDAIAQYLRAIPVAD